MDKLKEMFPGKVSPIIRENVSVAEAPGHGKPVIISARISKGADDYRVVMLWLDEQFSGAQHSADILDLEELDDAADFEDTAESRYTDSYSTL